MLEDGPVEDSEDFGTEEPVCIDGVIFYGPITDRERIVKERFERRQKERLKPQFLPASSNKEFSGSMTMASEESKNDINDVSIYESFSIDESKYESFNDSLDERKFLNPNEINVSKFSSENINFNKRKFQGKQMLKGSICDSLEDIHSLVSNVEKLSISEEIENINIYEKNHIYDDSLRNDVCLENKKINSVDQNYDDDSLAILDFEKTFDDSLEEADILSFSHMDNVVILRNGENAEISVENLAKENAVTKNLFETSVEVIFENAGYFENSEEGNAEIPKQLSFTADSLSLSENMSKDSLDGLPVNPKYLKQKTSKKSLSSLNRDASRNSLELEYCDNMPTMNDMDSNCVSKQNLSHNFNEHAKEQFTDIKRNIFDSNDTIIIEDSFIKSPEVTTSIKKENPIKDTFSVNQQVKDFSFQKKDSWCKNDCIKSYSDSASASNTHSAVIKNDIKISDESINKIDIHPNDTICIDDSFIMPQNTSLIKDESHLINTENQKNNQENVATEYPNDIIYVANFVQPRLNIKSEKCIPNEKVSKKHINSKFCTQNPIKQEPENLKIESHPNDTICIDDSFNLPQNNSLNQDELYSFETQQFENQKDTKHILSSKIKSPPKPKLSDDSFIASSPPMLNKNSGKNSSSLKKKKEKFIQGEDFKSCFQSPVKHHLRHLEKNDERNFTANDTICIDNSPIEPLSIKMEKKNPSLNNSSKKSRKSPHQDKNTDSKIHIKSPIKHHVRHVEKNDKIRISNSNDTVYIDNSCAESLRVKTEKKSLPSNKDTKAPEFKKDLLNKRQFAAHQIAKAFDSSSEEFTKSSISNNTLKDSKNVIDYFKDALVLPKDLPKDSNLKLQLEVVFDENQGLNIVSVSTIDQCARNISPSITKVDSRREIVGITNQSPDLIDKNQAIAEPKVIEKISENSIASDKIICKGCSPDIPEVKPFVTKNCLEKNKTDSIFASDAQNGANEHNAHLLEALDLHDTSCSFIDNGFLQSRDSIMPLNLCIRNRSNENIYQYISKSESKENIPFLDKELVASDHSKSKKRSSTKVSNKTPSQMNCITDVKKSGSKANSTTKIPIRKIDNPFFTPVHQKVSKDVKSGSSTEKIFKNPLVKSVSATDNLTSAKPQETPRKHHFCSVRNSISRVPKSTPRSIPKKFQNIESPIAKYIGKPQIYTPLKTTHRFDGNLIVGNTEKTNKNGIKTPNSACKGSPQCSTGKL
ncbi:uncharacterized protein LOC129981695 isoform X1 [Argiope bruennichi]|uniref:uncharacterized protein LOC129981695 isoform X1 n=1 Tax=Argiope bruennichi TaxID=94029 RepID=UPI00249512E6|nr:uncharacterized protein LOC129981695 isoform X1 [Argiope bruennichi]